MILSVGHTKGGVGKSTLAIQIATYLKYQDKTRPNVWLVDTDPQRSASKAVIERNSNPLYTKLSAASYLDGKELTQQVKNQEHLWNEIIIDIGARDSNSFRAALMLSDVLLIPVIPRIFDLEALSELYALLEAAWCLDAKVKAYAILSCTDQNMTFNKQAREFIENNYPKIEFLDAPVARRKAIGMSSAFGISVFEEKKPDEKACAEIEKLVQSLYPNISAKIPANTLVEKKNVKSNKKKGDK